jgi:hypothetical protein
MPKWLEGTLVILGTAMAIVITWGLLLGEIEKQRKMFPCSPMGGVRQTDGSWKCNTPFHSGRRLNGNRRN